MRQYLNNRSLGKRKQRKERVGGERLDRGLRNFPEDECSHCKDPPSAH